MSQPPKQLKDRDWLYNQYVTLNKSASQIGRELECQQETVSRWLHKYQIELRPHGQDVSGEKSGLYHKPVSEERRKHIREGVIASYESGKNSRWTEEKRADWSKQMSGSGNYNYGRVTPEEQLFIVYLEDLENIEHEILCQTPFNILDFGNPLADQIEEWKNFI